MSLAAQVNPVLSLPDPLTWTTRLVEVVGEARPQLRSVPSNSSGSGSPIPSSAREGQ